MTAETRSPSTRRLVIYLGTSLLFLLPSVSGSVVSNVRVQDDASAQALGVAMNLPEVVMVETVTIPSRRRWALGNEETVGEEVARALDHERVRAYQRRNVAASAAAADDNDNDNDDDDNDQDNDDEDDDEGDEPKGVPRRKSAGANQARGEGASPVAAADPLITPAPELPPCLSGRNSLGRRQDSQQLQQLRQQLDQAQQQSRQAVQQISQQSQQLAQATARLNDELSRTQDQLRQAQDQARQAQDQARQNADQAKQAQDQARQANDQAKQAQDQARQANDQAKQAQDQAKSASDAAVAAQKSAENAVAIAQASIASSAGAQIAANLASATSSAAASAASIIDAARLSASSIMAQAASQVSAARADATLARAEASTQISQAQGAAVSVTQAALAVVGTFIGSSLLTILAFYLILRYRRKKLDKERSIRPPISYPQSFAGSEAGSLGAPYGGGGNEKLGSRGGYSSNGYPADIKERPATSGNGGDAGNNGAYALRRSSSHYADQGTVENPQTGTKFSLFPKTNGASPGDTNPKSGQTTAVPSLDTWLRAGQVSPFGAPGVTRPEPAASAPKRDPRLPPMGLPVTPARTGPVMKPGNKLPLRGD